MLTLAVAATLALLSAAAQESRPTVEQGQIGIPLLYRKAMRGLHLSDPGVKRYRSATVKIETARPWPLEIDGDYLGESPVEISLLPGALRFKI